MNLLHSVSIHDGEFALVVPTYPMNREKAAALKYCLSHSRAPRDGLINQKS